MTQKRGSRVSSEETEDLGRVHLQAVLLADSFTMKFRPITLERPKVLLPLVNVPMIEYSLVWLESVGVDEVFVFCCSHAEKVKDYLQKSHWFENPTFTVTIIESHDCISAGDALRTIYNQSTVIRGDFILISGDTVSNACLKRALQEHKDRRKKDPLAVMTMVIKHSKPSIMTQHTRFGNDEITMAIDPETKQLLHYEDKAVHMKGMISLDKSLLSDSCSFQLHNDKEDCYIDICSQEVLSLFTDNFDYQHLRRHFVKGLLVDDIMGYKIFTHEIRSSYAARVDNFRSYNTISKDLIQRWAYPFVSNVQFSENCPQSMLKGIYKEPDVAQSRSAKIGAFSVLGKDTVIGDGTTIHNSVVGRNCILGNNVSIKGCYVWDNVTIEDNCKLSYVIVCDGVHLKAGVILEPGVILSFKVVVGQQVIVPAYSKVSLCPQPLQRDSDEEPEYANTNSAVIESPSIASALDATHFELEMGANEATISGQGYIWSACNGGMDDEWRYSVAPIPKEKLLELSLNISTCPDLSNEDPSNIPASRELHSDSESVDPDDNEFDCEDYWDDFEKEVEATFRRAVDEVPGVNQDNVILEVNSLKFSYNLSYADCAGALFQSVLKLGLAAPYSDNGELLQSAIQTITKWKDLLKHYVKTIDEEIEVILKFEEMCLESTKEYAPLFSCILIHLYKEDLASKDGILTWASEKDGADDSDKVFVMQSELFIQRLSVASEDEDNE